MEAAAALSLRSCSLIGRKRGDRESCGILRVSRGFDDERGIQAGNLRGSRSTSCSVRAKGCELRITCCYKKSGVGGSSNICSSLDEALILKRKSEDILPYLNGRCIYLVGMMGSGKTTVGKILSEALGYSFFDSDKLVEQAVGMSSVAQIFKERSEVFFRDSESDVLRDLSSMSRLVVSTGGGAVIRPVNWKYMKQGLTVWLDVPLEALARRIAAVGTGSRPLLNQDSGDPYTKAFMRLSTLSEERGEAYANADARVCLQNIAEKQGHGDVSSLTPMTIALEGVEMDTQQETQSSLKKNIVWTTEMDNCVTEALIEQMERGLKPDRNFQHIAYQAACDALFVKCGTRVNVAHLKNRLKTLKKDLGAFQDMLNFGSGFAFNQVTRLMDAEPKVWEVYLKAHPGARQYRHKAVPSFENLQILYSKDRATGLGAETVKERHVRLEKEKEVSNSINTEQEGDKEIDQEDDIESVAPPCHQEQAPKASSSKVTYKRKYGASNHNISEDFHMLKTGMDSVASAILSCAPRVYTEEEIFEEVSKVEGLDEDSQLLAYDYLCEDAVRGRTFIGLPIKRRKRWLELKLARG